MSTLFTKIINREIPADIVFENDRLIVIKDINPAAPVHLLLIPKKEIPTLQSVEEEDLSLMSDVVATAQMLADQLGLIGGYRLITNSGPDAGQEIAHLHFHLLAGGKLGKLG